MFTPDYKVNVWQNYLIGHELFVLLYDAISHEDVPFLDGRVTFNWRLSKEVCSVNFVWENWIFKEKQETNTVYDLISPENDCKTYFPTYVIERFLWCCG